MSRPVGLTGRIATSSFVQCIMIHRPRIQIVVSRKDFASLKTGHQSLVEAILDGRQPDGVRLEDLPQGFPVEWERQNGRFGR